MDRQTVIQCVTSFVVHFCDKVFCFKTGICIKFFLFNSIFPVVLIDLVHGIPHRLRDCHKSVSVHTIVHTDLASLCRNGAVHTISKMNGACLIIYPCSLFICRNCGKVIHKVPFFSCHIHMYASFIDCCKVRIALCIFVLLHACITHVEYLVCTSV